MRYSDINNNNKKKAVTPRDQKPPALKSTLASGLVLRF